VIVYVARHGESTWNREGRYQGQCDAPLSDTGRTQAELLARALSPRPIARVIASPLVRCIESARPLAEGLRIDIETDDRLLEIAHGVWEGRLREDIEREDAATMRAWREAPECVHFEGGESLGDVLARWASFAATLEGSHDIAICTHDVLVRLAILHATGRPLSEFWAPRVLNGAFARFHVEGGDWRLLDECQDKHLAGFAVDTARQAL